MYSLKNPNPEYIKDPFAIFRTKGKYTNNQHICNECGQNNLIDNYDVIICNDCGVVNSYSLIATPSSFENCKYKSRSVYKRKTYVKVILKQKIPNLPCKIKHRIIDEANKIFFEYNKRYDKKRKSFLSYAYMFRYILEKIGHPEYMCHFHILRTKSIIKLNRLCYESL